MRNFATLTLLGLLFFHVDIALADSLVPAPGQFDVELGSLLGFPGSNSFTQVRENQIEGTPLSFSGLGIRTVRVPFIDSAFWFSERNALRVQLRDFSVTGSHFVGDPVNYNGATIAGGQTVHSNPVWYSAGIYYDHRWMPSWLRAGDVRGLFGLEYTSINFRINSGHASVTPTSVGTETKEDYFMQELPVPTFGLEVQRRLTPNVVFGGSLFGNWINHWNSQRKEGGTIYLSQRKLEAHVQARFENDGMFRSLHPMIGLFYFNFYQNEQSPEDGNVIRLSMAGPEAGLKYEF